MSQEQVVGEVWRSGKHQFLPGYHAERKVIISDTDDCTVGLRIFKGDNGQPVYTCTCVCKDGDHGGTYGHAARPVIENFVGLCGACGSASGSGRRWSGTVPLHTGHEFGILLRQEKMQRSLPKRQTERKNRCLRLPRYTGNPQLKYWKARATTASKMKSTRMPSLVSPYEKTGDS